MAEVTHGLESFSVPLSAGGSSLTIAFGGSEPIRISCAKEIWQKIEAQKGK